MGGVPSERTREGIAVAAITALAAGLLLVQLDRPYLWQDEAQTALVARTIASHGVPLGHDGRNSFSQELGREFGEGYVWKWHTWLSFYLVALSFALFGEGTASARLPFALLGVASVPLAWWTGRVWWRSRGAALAGALVLALSVPFLLLSRQCRYYTLASFLSLLGLLAYTRLGSGRRATLGLFAAATLLFHAHYVYSATLLASLLLHALLFERARLAPLLRASAGVVALNLPWIVWFSSIRPGGESYLASVLDLGKAARFGVEYARLALTYLLPAWLLLAVPVLLAWRRARGEPLPGVSPETRSGVALIFVFSVVSVLGLSLLSPLLFYRYLAPLGPPLALLAGLLLASLWSRSRLLAAGAFATLVLSSSLPAYLREITGDPRGPLEAIVRHLRAHGSDADTVAISYGDLPLKFYTNLRVVGGLTGEDLGPARDAQWLIPRAYVNTGEDRRVGRALLAIARSGSYEEILLDARDAAPGYREDPRVHRFGPVPARNPRVRVFRKRP